MNLENICLKLERKLKYLVICYMRDSFTYIQMKVKWMYFTENNVQLDEYLYLNVVLFKYFIT